MTPLPPSAAPVPRNLAAAQPGQLVRRPFEPGDIAAGKYRVDRPIGVGGMGVVYRVQAETRELALKTILPGYVLTKTARRRFLREAQTLMNLNHPNIVEVVDYGQFEDDTPFIVMELLRGRDLRAELRVRGALPPREAVGYVQQMAAGVAAAHAAGVVHRDLKPQNAFVLGLTGARSIKILDFGISKTSAADAATLTTSTETFGTPGYMSPEQIVACSKVDQRTDIWSLGVVLYYLLTRRLPFARPTAAATIAAIPSAPFQPASQLVAGVQPELDAVIARCLEKDPNQRYPNALELTKALVRFGPTPGRSLRAPAIDIPSTFPPVRLRPPPALAQPVPSQQPSTPPHSEAPLMKEQLWSRLRRRPGTTGLLGGIVGALIIGIVALVLGLGSEPVASGVAPPPQPSEPIEVTARKTMNIAEPARVGAAATPSLEPFQDPRPILPSKPARQHEPTPRNQTEPASVAPAVDTVAVPLHL